MVCSQTIYSVIVMSYNTCVFFLNIFLIVHLCVFYNSWPSLSLPAFWIDP